MLDTWTVEEGEASSVVRAANGFVVSVAYFDDDQAETQLAEEEARRPCYRERPVAGTAGEEGRKRLLAA